MKKILFLAFMALACCVRPQCPPDTVVYGTNYIQFTVAVSEFGPGGFCNIVCDGNAIYHKVIRVRMDSTINAAAIQETGVISMNARLIITDTVCTYSVWDSCVVNWFTSNQSQAVVTGRYFNVIIESKYPNTYFVVIGFNTIPQQMDTPCGALSVEEPQAGVRKCEGGTGYTDVTGRHYSEAPPGISYDHSRCNWIVK